MSIRAVSSAINASFIRSFQGLASSGGPAIGANAAQPATIFSGLRLGARTFATSIQNLNSAVSVINLADSALKKLSEVVDGMIGLAEKATSVSAGSETRRKLQAQFDDLVDGFREIVESSQLNDIDYLTEEGLATLFQRVGLDQEASDGVVAVLAQFVKPATEDSFASEDTKATRPVSVPVLKKSKLVQETNLALNTADSFGISSDYTVYDQNGSSVYIRSTDGSVTLANNSQDLGAVNESLGSSPGETDGYHLAMTTEDPGGDNPSYMEVVVLVDSAGNFVRQVSGTIDPDDQTQIVGISADNLTAGYYVYNSVGTIGAIQSSIYLSSVVDISDPPGMGLTLDSIDLGFPATLASAKLSNDASALIYSADDGVVYWREVGVGSTDIGISNPLDYGFADSQVGIFLDSSGSSIFAYNKDTASSTTLVLAQNISNLAVLEVDSRVSVNDGDPSGSPKVATIAYVSSQGGTNELTVLSYDLNSGTLKTRFRRDLGSGTVDDISLAYQNDGNTSKDRIDVGVKGALPSLFGDSDTEIYRVKETKFATNSSLFAQASSEPSKILDGNLFSRADSYRLLADLRALKSQIGDNLDALENAREYIGNNIELVRVAGFAFLSISDQLSGAEEADEVAKMVAAEIRRNATQAQAAQAENLKNIVSQTTALLES